MRRLPTFPAALLALALVGCASVNPAGPVDPEARVAVGTISFGSEVESSVAAELTPRLASLLRKELMRRGAANFVEGAQAATATHVLYLHIVSASYVFGEVEDDELGTETTVEVHIAGAAILAPVTKGDRARVASISSGLGDDIVRRSSWLTSPWTPALIRKELLDQAMLIVANTVVWKLQLLTVDSARNSM